MNTFLVSVAVIFVIGFCAGRFTVSVGTLSKKIENSEFPAAISADEPGGGKVPALATKELPPQLGSKTPSHSREQELLNQIASLSQPCPPPEGSLPSQESDPEEGLDGPDVMDSELTIPEKYEEAEGE